MATTTIQKDAADPQKEEMQSRVTAVASQLRGRNIFQAKQKFSLTDIP